jgi:hypothetical protein
VTTNPPAGAIVLIVILPVEGLPPTTLVGLRVTDTIVGGVTVKVDVSEVPLSVAVTVAEVAVGTEAVLAVNVPKDLPDPMVTETGTVTAPLMLESLTTIPVEGAVPLSVTVPIAVFVLATLVGLKLIDVKTGGSIVNSAVRATAPYEAVIVAIFWLDTPLVFTGNVMLV